MKPKRKTTLKKKVQARIGSGERLKQFMREGNFDVHTSGKKIMNVGLTWGDSKRLSKKYGREEQISLLNYLQRNPKIVKRFILK